MGYTLTMKMKTLRTRTRGEREGQVVINNRLNQLCTSFHRASTNGSLSPSL
jgi:hypothetical protein